MILEESKVPPGDDQVYRMTLIHISDLLHFSEFNRLPRNWIISYYKNLGSRLEPASRILPWPGVIQTIRGAGHISLKRLTLSELAPIPTPTWTLLPFRAGVETSLPHFPKPPVISGRKAISLLLLLLLVKHGGCIFP